ncbi:MAG: hypothetical protein WC648_04265 [Candidatus Paceibacterota bacterium]
MEETREKTIVKETIVKEEPARVSRPPRKRKTTPKVPPKKTEPAATEQKVPPTPPWYSRWWSKSRSYLAFVILAIAVTGTIWSVWNVWKMFNEKTNATTGGDSSTTLGATDKSSKKSGMVRVDESPLPRPTQIIDVGRAYPPLQRNAPNYGGQSINNSVTVNGGTNNGPFIVTYIGFGPTNKTVTATNCPPKKRHVRSPQVPTPSCPTPEAAPAPDVSQLDNTYWQRQKVQPVQQVQQVQYVEQPVQRVVTLPGPRVVYAPQPVVVYNQGYSGHSYNVSPFLNQHLGGTGRINYSLNRHYH